MIQCKLSKKVNKPILDLWTEPLFRSSIRGGPSKGFSGFWISLIWNSWFGISLIWNSGFGISLFWNSGFGFSYLKLGIRDFPYGNSRFGIYSKIGSRFVIESMRGRCNAKNNHWVYGIARNFGSGLWDWRTLLGPFKEDRESRLFQADLFLTFNCSVLVMTFRRSSRSLYRHPKQFIYPIQKRWNSR